MISAVGDALTSVIGWVGNVVTALTGTTGALKDLLPLLALGIGISVFFLAVKAIRKITWGA